MTVELYPHQQKAVNELHNGSILWGDVGTGKSLTAAAYYMKNYVGYGEDFDVVVITTAKKRDSLDWQRDFAKFGVGRDRDGSVAGCLTVDSWNNLGSYRDREGCFFIFDEQRVVGSGQWTKDFIRIARNNRWILLSATPGDVWLDYIPVFVANGYYKNRTEFLREHVVFNRYSKFPKVDRYIGVNKLVKLRNDTLVHMAYDRHTTRHTRTVDVSYDAEAFETVLEKRWNIYKNRPIRDVAELFGVLRRVVNSDASRLAAVRELIQKHPKLIVFYNYDYELELLRSLATSDVESSGVLEPTQILAGITSSAGSLFQDVEPSSTASAAIEKPLPEFSRSTSTTTKTPSTFQVAEWNGHKHEPIPKTDRWVYLVQYAAGSEGWNCTETDAMLFYSLTYSYKNWHQAHGRIDRLNTEFKDLYYFVLMSKSMIDRAVWASLKAKKSFNEASFIRRKIDTRS